MAFERTQLFLVSQVGEVSRWEYHTVSDTPATVIAGTYIPDGYGLNVGDDLVIKQFTSTAKTALTAISFTTVSATASTGVTAQIAPTAAPVPLTATADGLTTGLIPTGARAIQVTATDANHIITLPTPVIGQEIFLFNASGTGFELRSSSPTTIGINGGTGSAAESALASTAIFIRAVAVSATNWVAHSYIAAGTESAVQVAAP